MYEIFLYAAHFLRKCSQHYMSHMLQGSKPSTSSGPVEKVNIEPPTANIKPMAGPSSTQSKQQPVSSDSYLVLEFSRCHHHHSLKFQLGCVCSPPPETSAFISVML